MLAHQIVTYSEIKGDHLVLHRYELCQMQKEIGRREQHGFFLMAHKYLRPRRQKHLRIIMVSCAFERIYYKMCSIHSIIYLFHQIEFFDEFERQTTRIKDIAESDTHKVQEIERQRMIEEEAEKRRREKEEKKKEMNDFFDEFERSTGGENFRTTNAAR